MGKIEKYKNIVAQIVEEAVSMSPFFENGVENQLIIDNERGITYILA